MAQIFRKDTMNFKLRQSPIPEFSWHTSEKLSELAKSEHIQFNVRLLDP